MMETRGWLIVFLPLVLVIGLIVAGSYFGGPWDRVSLAVGIIGGLAWIGFILWLANAMNTDI